MEKPESAGLLLTSANRGGNFSDKRNPGYYGLRVTQELRAVAQRKNPTLALGSAAASYYRGDQGTAYSNNALLWGNAFADLAITGRDAYDNFRKHPPSDGEIAAQARNLLNPPLAAPKPIDEAKLEKAIRLAKIRAYEVAWALRNTDPQAGFQLRQHPSLGWIAVSAEDDPPARPVNVPSGIPVFDSMHRQISAYPQYEAEVKMCPSMSAAPYRPVRFAPRSPNCTPVSFHIRYTVASLPYQRPGSVVPTFAITKVLPQSGPITGGTQVHLSITGGSTTDMAVSFGGVTPPQARCLNSDCWFMTPPYTKPGQVDIVVSAPGASPTVPRVKSSTSEFTYTPAAELAGFGHDSSTTDPGAYLVGLDGNAPAGGALVELKSGNPNAVSVPQTVTIRGVAAQVPLTFLPVPKDEPVKLTATYHGRSIPVNETAPGWPPIRIDPIPSANGGKFTLDANVTITLPTPAPTGGTSVALTSSDPNAFSPPLPPSVRVPGGSFYTTFKVTAAKTPVNAMGIPVFKPVTVQATPANGTPQSLPTRVPFLLLQPRQSPEGGPNGTRQY
jgi:hypothetical protein